MGLIGKEMTAFAEVICQETFKFTVIAVLVYHIDESILTTQIK